jgi:hypothetical protein
MSLLAFLLCTAAQAQSIDIGARTGLAVSNPSAIRLERPDNVLSLASTMRPPLVTHFIESLCLSAPVQAPSLPFTFDACLLSTGTPVSPRAASADIGALTLDPRAHITSSTLASDSPASGPVLWLRADAGVRSTAGRVSVWQDLSGQGNHATMATLARQPMLVTGAVNGEPVIHFGGAQSMYLTSWVSPTSFTIFIVGKNDGATGPFSMILGPGGQSPNNQLRWLGGDRVECIGQGNGMPFIISTIGSNVVYHELSLRYDGSVMTIYRDGLLVSSHAFTTTGPWTFSNVGAYTSLYFMYGDLAEVLIYPTALPEVDRIRTSRYHRSRYGL